jgi:hypothetical protein
LTGKYFEITYVSYTNRWQAFPQDLDNFTDDAEKALSLLIFFRKERLKISLKTSEIKGMLTINSFFLNKK